MFSNCHLQWVDCMNSRTQFSSGYLSVLQWIGLEFVMFDHVLSTCVYYHTFLMHVYH